MCRYRSRLVAFKTLTFHKVV